MMDRTFVGAVALIVLASCLMVFSPVASIWPVMMFFLLLFDDLISAIRNQVKP